MSSHSKAEIKDYWKTEVIKFKDTGDNHMKSMTVPHYLAWVYYLELSLFQFSGAFMIVTLAHTQTCRIRKRELNLSMLFSPTCPLTIQWRISSGAFACNLIKQRRLVPGIWKQLGPILEACWILFFPHRQDFVPTLIPKECMHLLHTMEEKNERKTRLICVCVCTSQWNTESFQ